MLMMIEPVARLIYSLIQPGSLLVILLVAVISLFYAGYHRRAVRALGILLVLWLVFSTPFLPDYLTC